MPQAVCKVTKDKSPEKGSGSMPTWRAIANSLAMDRDDDVVLPLGADITNFNKNPVMLQIHNYYQVPVGKVLNIEVKETEILFDFEFTDTDLGKEYNELYEKGYMSAFSIGFVPKERVRIDDQTPRMLSFDFGDKGKTTLDLDKYPKSLYQVFSKWELLEISPVPVPSNPEALLQRSLDGMVRKFHDPAKQSMVKGIAAGFMNQALANLKSVMADMEGFTLTGWVPKHSVSNTIKGEYNRDDCVAKLARWASDGSGTKDKMDWSKFSIGFTSFDPDSVDKYSSYELCHHTIEDGQLVVHDEGLKQAIRSLWESCRDHFDKLSDIETSSLAHLKQHWLDLGRDFSEFNKDFYITLDREDMTNPIGDQFRDSDGIKELQDRLSKLEARVADDNEAVRVRMSIMQEVIIEKIEESGSKIDKNAGSQQDDDKDLEQVTDGWMSDLTKFVDKQPS